MLDDIRPERAAALDPFRAAVELAGARLDLMDLAYPSVEAEEQGAASVARMFTRGKRKGWTAPVLAPSALTLRQATARDAYIDPTAPGLTYILRAARILIDDLSERSTLGRVVADVGAVVSSLTFGCDHGPKGCADAACCALRADAAAALWSTCCGLRRFMSAIGSGRTLAAGSRCGWMDAPPGLTRGCEAPAVALLGPAWLPVPCCEEHKGWARARGWRVGVHNEGEAARAARTLSRPPSADLIPAWTAEDEEHAAAVRAEREARAAAVRVDPSLRRPRQTFEEAPDARW